MHDIQVKGILSSNNGMNIYRGCSHGCIYCDSRSTCYGMDHPFEDIAVKVNAPQLLEHALRSKRKRCMIGTGSMCDPYMHCEEQLGLTRRCLELIHQYEYGATMITKSDRILRDLDLLVEIQKKSKCVVQLTMTTYDEELCRIIEPKVCTTKRRFQVLEIMREHGISTVVWLCPILPMINDTPENIRGILDYCVKAKVKGILCFGMGLTLREGNRAYFYQALDKYFPGMKEQYQKKYGYAYQLPSDRQEELMNIFQDTCRKHHIMYHTNEIFHYLQEFPENKGYQQLDLFQ